MPARDRSAMQAEPDAAGALHVPAPAAGRIRLHGAALADLVGTIYAAGCDEHLWPQALQCLSIACRARGAAVTLVHGCTRERVVLAHGIPEALLRDLGTAGQPPASSTLAVNDDTAAPAEQWLSTPLPLPAAKCARLIVHACGCDRALHDEREAVLALVIPHLAGALQIGLRLAREAAYRSEQQRESDGLPFGRILLDADCRVVQINRSAQAILDAADGLILTETRLTAYQQRDDALLQRGLEQIRASAGPHQQMLTVHRRHGTAPYALRIALIQRMRASIFAGSPAIELLIVDHERASADMAFAAACWPELSRVELRVLERLLRGDDLSQCAAHLNIARSTAKLHVEHIFRKTGARRQSELLRLTLLPLIAGLPRSEEA